jgi:hypothetical protein
MPDPAQSYGELFPFNTAEVLAVHVVKFDVDNT